MDEIEQLLHQIPYQRQIAERAPEPFRTVHLALIDDAEQRLLAMRQADDTP